MKIKGPGGIPPEIPDVGEGKKAEGKPGAFAEKLAGPGAAGAPDPTQKVTSDPVAQVSADLRAGKIDGKQAVDRLVALTIDQGPAAHLPADLKQKLRAQLEAMVAEDPYFTTRTERLK